MERSQQLLKDLQEATSLISFDDLYSRTEGRIRRLEKALSKQDEIYGVTSGVYITFADAALTLGEASIT